MTPEDRATILIRIFGPLCLILSPIWLILMIPAGLHAMHTRHPLSAGQWIFMLFLGIGGVICGLYCMITQYGWFQKKDE